MDISTLSEELLDPVFTCTVSSSGRLRKQAKRDRIDSDEMASKSKIAKTCCPPAPTMLVVTYVNIKDHKDNKKNKYVVLVDKMLPVVDHVRVDVFDHDYAFYNIPSAPMGIETVSDIKDFSYTVYTVNKDKRVKLSLYGGKQLYDCSIVASKKPSGWLVRGHSIQHDETSGGQELRAFVDVHKLAVQGETQADYEPPVRPHEMCPDVWQSVKTITNEILKKHVPSQTHQETYMDGVESVKETKQQDLNCTII